MEKNERLAEEQLIAKLDEWFETVADYGEAEDEQAYTQLKELIQQKQTMTESELHEWRMKESERFEKAGVVDE
jgi:hypothetical protein